MNEHYRIVPQIDAFELQVQDPCKFQWHGLALRDSVQACIDARDQHEQGEPLIYIEAEALAMARGEG